MKSLFRVTTVKIALIAALALFCGRAVAQDAAAPNPCEITTKSGKISGVFNQKKGVCSFKGIPYAQPPVGDLRFAPPQPVKPWADTLKATKFGEMCIQEKMSFPAASDRKASGSEDCLFLNVWRPMSESSKLLPVMFFIHGGGFTIGSGHEEFYEGTNISSQGGVILVTINYRLNVFGFLAHPSLKDAQGHAGNYGMLDQVAALQWVKDNISSFGGDPNNITIFGESAGGMSVAMLIVSPLSNKSFAKGIMQSGPVFVMNRTMDRELKAGQTVAAAVGCADPATAAACLRAIDAKELYKAANVVRPGSLVTMEKGKGFSFSPVVDGYFLPDSPLKLLAEKKFPSSIKMILGSNKDEGSIFVKDHKYDSSWDMKTTFRDDVDKITQMFGLDMYNEEMLKKYPESAFESPRFAYQEMVADMMFYCPNRLFAGYAAANGNDVYDYYFNILPIPEKAQKKLQGMDNIKTMINELGVFHGAELPFIYNNFKLMGFDLSAPETGEASKKVMSLWTSFAKTGVPTADGVPTWPKFNSADSPILYIGAPVMESKTNFKADACPIVDKMMKDAYLK